MTAAAPAEARATWQVACAFVQGALASSGSGLLPGTAVSLAQALDHPSATLRLSVRSPRQAGTCRVRLRASAEGVRLCQQRWPGIRTARPAHALLLLCVSLPPVSSPGGGLMRRSALPWCGRWASRAGLGHACLALVLAATWQLEHDHGSCSRVLPYHSLPVRTSQAAPGELIILIACLSAFRRSTRWTSWQQRARARPSRSQRCSGGSVTATGGSSQLRSAARACSAARQLRRWQRWELCCRGLRAPAGAPAAVKQQVRAQASCLSPVAAGLVHLCHPRS